MNITASNQDSALLSLLSVGTNPGETEALLTLDGAAMGGESADSQSFLEFINAEISALEESDAALEQIDISDMDETSLEINDLMGEYELLLKQVDSEEAGDDESENVSALTVLSDEIKLQQKHIQDSEKYADEMADAADLSDRSDGNSPFVTAEQNKPTPQHLPVDGKEMPISQIGTVSSSRLDGDEEGQNNQSTLEMNQIHIQEESDESGFEYDADADEAGFDLKAAQSKNNPEIADAKTNVKDEMLPTANRTDNTVRVGGQENNLNPPLMNALNNSNPLTQSPLAQVTSTMHLSQNPGTNEWGQALGEKIQWMVNSKLNSAEIRIDPPNLGKMEVKINMTDDGAQIVIHTQHANTRDLIDAASFRLRDVLLEAGHQQVDVNVSHRESGSENGQNNTELAANPQQDSEEDLEMVAGSMNTAYVADNNARLDLFA